MLINPTQTIYRVLLFSALGAITTLAFLPDYNALPPIVSFSDILNHTAAFMVLFLLLHLAYPKLFLPYRLSLLLSYAVWIEAVQYFLPTRFASISDIFADSFGIFLAFMLIKTLQYLPVKIDPS